MTITINLEEGKCIKCHKKTFIGKSGLCLACAGKLASEKIKAERAKNRPI